MSALNLLPVFLVGLAGSVHCVGMCGGIVSAFSVAPAARPAFPVAVVTLATPRAAESMLRIAAYELQHRIDVPYRVVIDEALKTVKRFGSEHGHTYVNGVLDKAAAAWRAPEVGALRGR